MTEDENKLRTDILDLQKFERNYENVKITYEGCIDFLLVNKILNFMEDILTDEVRNVIHYSSYEDITKIRFESSKFYVEYSRSNTDDTKLLIKIESKKSNAVISYEVMNIGNGYRVICLYSSSESVNEENDEPGFCFISKLSNNIESDYAFLNLLYFFEKIKKFGNFLITEGNRKKKLWELEEYNKEQLEKEKKLKEVQRQQQKTRMKVMNNLDEF